MKKIILFLVVFVLFSCVSNDTQEKRRRVYRGNQGSVVVSENGGIILEKTWDDALTGPGLARHIQVPKFILICDGDTVMWTEVPGKIYDRYNQGDTIEAL